jgi:hypothetical protein
MLSGDSDGQKLKKSNSPWSLDSAMALVDLCRLCGTDTLNIVRNDIFKGEGRLKKYAPKISDCLSLQVSHRISQSSRLRGINFPPTPGGHPETVAQASILNHVYSPVGWSWTLDTLWCRRATVWLSSTKRDVGPN